MNNINSEENSGNKVSESLINKDIYSVCYTGLESISNFHSELYELRKSFFEGGRRTVRLKKAVEENGIPGKARGRIRKHSLLWKKTCGKLSTEEAFLASNNYIVVRRDMSGNICGKIYFDKNMAWTKTEYFTTDDFNVAAKMFKPAEITDAIEEFTYDPKKKNYSTVLLFPVPYNHKTAEQSVINARHGDEMLLLAMESGEYSYCAEEEKEQRLRSIDEIASGTIMMTPAWEVKDGEIPEPAIKNDAETPDFKDIDSIPEIESETEAATEVLIETDSEEKEAIAVEENTTEENTVEEISTEEAAISPEDLVLTVDNTELKEHAELTIVSEGEKYNYTGRMVNGKREGRGRTQQENGLTAYDGDYSDNLRDGFGASYYKSGELSYVGEWSQDKKNGMGVSFRERDHAININKWENGKPGKYTSIFDPEGNLRFSGKIIDGKKQGASVSQRLDDGSIFISKWKDGVECGTGSLFDSEGNLVYTGGWKDGKREGHGTEFDAAGNTVYSGEWKDDNYLNGILYRKIES